MRSQKDVLSRGADALKRLERQEPSNPEIRKVPETLSNSNFLSSTVINEDMSNNLQTYKQQSNKFRERVNKTDSLFESAKERVKIEIARRDDTRFNYFLAKETKFELFLDHLTSELRAKNLLYVIDPIVENSSNSVENVREDRLKARTVIMNRIADCYQLKTYEIKDPADLIKRLKELKRGD